VATPKSMLKKFERELLDEDWEHIKPGVEVKICAAPGDTRETFVPRRSPLRREKERAMRERQLKGLEDGLARLKDRIASPVRALRDRDTRPIAVWVACFKGSRASRAFMR